MKKALPKYEDMSAPAEAIFAAYAAATKAMEIELKVGDYFTCLRRAKAAYNREFKRQAEKLGVSVQWLMNRSHP